MESLYDVQQLLKRFGIFVYVGSRIYDIELMTIELKNLHDSRLIDHDTYMTAWRILKREHRVEESRKKGKL
ncbi:MULTISPECIES: YqgQ family protein [Enterococcus]|uniref:YqgQ family protein n=1 Tax=Enterococcus TaxID=1350 RepID=UPI0015F24B74|nr:YqgQ family protein [Enterococcus hirae]MBA5269016.1 YqgQ family protein [Enterococcus hirae]MEB5878628.1 YqgQ family protein [Enterococcus hirae]MEB5905613.1 YqgQ family protein [Enterococcus hirae]